MSSQRGTYGTLTRKRVERAARIYQTQADAARAIGCTRSMFSRKLREYGLKMRTKK